MASKNSIKPNLENAFYHAYNRGVEKRLIFQDDQDHKVFLSYLKEYLSPPPDPEKLLKSITFKDTVFKGIPRQPKNFHKRLELLSYCLMPNHFHLLVKQVAKTSMESFIHSLLLRYSMYFNKKYDRVGPLFQGRFKGVLIDNDSYLLHLTRYIHLNPSEYVKDLSAAYSSYAEYLGLRNTLWVKPDFILNFFNKTTLPEFIKVNSYRNFVENYEADSEALLGNAILE